MPTEETWDLDKDAESLASETAQNHPSLKQPWPSWVLGVLNLLFAGIITLGIFSYLNGIPWLNEPVGNGNLTQQLKQKVNPTENTQLVKIVWDTLQASSKITTKHSEDMAIVEQEMLASIQKTLPDILVRTGNYLCPIGSSGFCSWSLWLQPLALSFPSNREVANALLSCKAWQQYSTHLTEPTKAKITVTNGPCTENQQDRFEFATILPLMKVDPTKEEKIEHRKKQTTRQEDINKLVEQAIKPFRIDFDFNLRRIFFGLIQTITIFLALSGLGVLLWSIADMLLFTKPLIKVGVLFLSTADHFCHYAAVITALYRNNPNNILIRLTHLTNEAYKASSGSVNETRTVLGEDTTQLREELMSQGAWVRFVVFAVPAIGFVGTVLGISQALGGADKVLSEPTDTLKIAAIQAMTTQLAVAFDTTLVSLLMGIGINLLVELSSRLQESYLFAVYDKIVQKNLNKLSGANPNCVDNATSVDKPSIDRPTEQSNADNAASVDQPVEQSS